MKGQTVLGAIIVGFAFVRMGGLGAVTVQVPASATGSLVGKNALFDYAVFTDESGAEISEHYDVRPIGVVPLIVCKEKD